MLISQHPKSCFSRLAHVCSARPTGPQGLSRTRLPNRKKPYYPIIVGKPITTDTMTWRQTVFPIFDAAIRGPRTGYLDLISMSANWAMAWSSLFDNAVPLPLLPNMNMQKLIQVVGVGNRDIK
jgi:hypothetical protein